MPFRKFGLNIFDHGRAAEWLCAIVMLFYALTLSWPAESLSGSAYRAFREMGLDDASLAAPVGMIAAARITALTVNGVWHRSPILRMVGAWFGMALFGMIGIGILWPTLTTGSPLSTGVSTYFVLALFDALSAYRSAADVRLAQQSREQSR